MVEVGPGVDGFAVGDRVWCNSLGHAGRQGSFAERVVVPADRLYQLPGGVDPARAVAAFHPAATACFGLFMQAELRVGETVVVGGGAGNVGISAIELAASAGAQVVATARPEDADRCRAAGAGTVIDYRDPHLTRLLAEAAPGGVYVYWNTSGQHDLDRAVSLLADGARVVVTAAARATVTLPILELYLRGARLLGFVLSKASVADLASAARMVNHRLAQGGLKCGSRRPCRSRRPPGPTGASRIRPLAGASWSFSDEHHHRRNPAQDGSALVSTESALWVHARQARPRALV